MQLPVCICNTNCMSDYIADLTLPLQPPDRLTGCRLNQVDLDYHDATVYAHFGLVSGHKGLLALSVDAVR